MGLLDDAIREHLDLKRRRGADPQELERLEREALGPVRRGPHDAFAAPSVEEPGLSAGYPDQQPTEAWSQSQDQPSFTEHGSELTDADAAGSWKPPEEAPIQSGIAVEPDVPSPAPPPPATPAEPPPPAPAETVPPSPAEAAPAGGPIDEDDYLEQETVEHDVEREHLEQSEQQQSEQDDMLEETPEFLQDTPDHDRLWFEQRPPRDFDLDG